MKRVVTLLQPPSHPMGDMYEALRAEASGGFEVRLVASRDELFDHLGDASELHLVIMHGEFGDGEHSGLELIRDIRILKNTAVVVAAEEGDVASVARAVSAGASDFIVRGNGLKERVATLLGKLTGLFDAFERGHQLAARNAELQETLQARFRIVGDSTEILALLKQIERVAGVPRPVLIQGERGTGKELVARAIHFAAGPASRPIITVNCAAFTDALLESELFGYEKGAFTGADSLRHGKFEQANGGTLFLDEIGHMSLPFQQKILRVVEYGTFFRIGGARELRTSARIIAATNCDLAVKIENGEFLRDLYDRLSFEVIQVPPLRERTGDIEVLARHFLNEFAREIPAFKGKTLAREALAALRRYCFPGNVREMKNIIERAAYRDTTSEITIEDLGLAPDAPANDGEGSFQERVDAFGRHLLVHALESTEGNQAAAARRLGLTYDQFRYYRRKYAI